VSKYSILLNDQDLQGLPSMFKYILCGYQLSVLYSSYSSSDCLSSLNQTCSRGQPAGRLTELYTLARAMVAVGGVCSETSHMCSVRSAMNCVTDLSVEVTKHDYTSSDDTVVCR